jgi:hypothetical protein
MTDGVVTVATDNGKNINLILANKSLSVYPVSADQQVQAEGATGRQVDAKGRTQAQWVDLVMKKFPNARIAQGKGPFSKTTATLPGGRQIVWTPTMPNTINAVSKPKMSGASDSSGDPYDFIKPGAMVKFGMWNKPQEHRTGRVVKMANGVVTVATDDGKNINLNLGSKSLSIAPVIAEQQGMAEGVAETLPMDDAVKVLRQYGADHFKTTSNELHFYKQGRPFRVDLVMNPDATRSVSISQLNSATRKLKGQGVAEEQLDELKCWSGYTRVQGVPAGAPGSCKKKTNEEDVAEATGDVKFDKMLKGITGKKEVAKQQKIDTKQQARDAFGGMFGGGNPADKLSIRKKGVAEGQEESCPHCGGAMFSEMIMNEKKDACYYKVKSRYKVWPSAYASGALVKCRKSGADSWGDGGKKNESSILEGIEQVDENLNKWFKEKWVRFGPDGKIRGDCARGDDSEGKPKCLPQSKAQNLGKEGRASAAARKRREDPNPERSGKAINVNTKKK